MFVDYNNKPYFNLNFNYYEVHSFNCLRGDVRLRKRCDCSQGARSQVHPQPRIRWFKQLSTSWKALSNAQILAWNKLAGTQAGHSVLGSSSKISGANLFMRLNYWIVYCGGEILQAPAAAADLRLVIQASAPQSNGITRAYSKAATIGGARACNTEEINLKVDYEEKNGTPSAAAPKSGELEADTVVKEILITAQSGARGTSDEKIRYYNLDAIISIGYRSQHHSLDAIISITAD